MAIYGLEVPFVFLEPHFVLLVLFRVCLLFALPLAGRRAIPALLLQLLTVLFCKLLDFLVLLGAVARGVLHWTKRPSVIAVGRLMGALVTSGTSAPPATVAATAAVGAPASGWLLPSVFFFFLFLLPPP
jgi:hypothetical protein